MPVRDGYSIFDYGWMVNQERRTRPFVDALRAAVGPESVVLDIGTGTGIFAFLACRFGAKRVYAIEPENAIELAKKCVPANPLADRIVWLKAFSTEIDLPERVDIVIADLHGNLPFHGGHLVSMIDARRRHLKPGGTVIPKRDLLYAAPIDSQAEHENIDSPWRKNDYGIDFSPGLELITSTVRRANSGSVPAEAMLAPAQCWGSIDYATIDSPGMSGEVEFAVARAGTMHGFYVWFDGEVSDELGFSNAPDLPPLPYGRSFFPMERPVEVAPGDRISLRLSATLVGSEYVFRWDTKVLATDGAQRAQFRQSTMQSMLLNPEDLRRAAVGYVPRPSRAARIDFDVLQGILEARPVEQIASQLLETYPESFTTFAVALTHVGTLTLKYDA